MSFLPHVCLSTPHATTRTGCNPVPASSLYLALDFLICSHTDLKAVLDICKAEEWHHFHTHLIWPVPLHSLVCTD